MRRATLAAGSAVLALFALVDCSAGSNGDESTGSAPEAAADQAAPDQDAGQGSGSNASGGVITQAVQNAAGRDIVVTVDLSITADDVAAAAREAATIATTSGGFVADQRTRGDADASLTLRVPTAEQAGAVESLQRLGEVDHLDRTSEDVTDQVVDTESRVASQRTSIARIQTLLDQATDLDQIITIESELATRQADLDALLSRQAELAALTSLATITVAIHAETDDEPAGSDVGFASGLAGGWDAFADVVRWTLAVVGAVLPFAVAVALIGVPVLWVVRRRRRAGTAGAGQPQAEAPSA